MSDHRAPEDSSAGPNAADSARVNRRGFLSGAAVGVVGGGALAYGGVKSALALSAAPELPPQPPLSNGDDGPGVAASVPGDGFNRPTERESGPIDLIVELIRQKYPDERLDDAALAVIRHDIASQLQRSRALSNYPLHGGDRPAPVFAPFLADHEEDS